MLTTLSRRNASASRRASSRSVFAANPALSLVFRGSTTQTARAGRRSASTNAHVGPLASTAIARCRTTPRAETARSPSQSAENRPSHAARRSASARTPGKTPCANQRRYTLGPWAVLLSQPGACVFERPHYLRRRDWATALSFDQSHRGAEIAEVHAPSTGRLRAAPRETSRRQQTGNCSTPAC